METAVNTLRSEFIRSSLFGASRKRRSPELVIAQLPQEERVPLRAEWSQTVREILSLGDKARQLGYRQAGADSNEVMDLFDEAEQIDPSA